MKLFIYIVIIVTLSFFPVLGHAQEPGPFITPLQIGMQEPVRDELHEVMEGTFENPGDVVHILQVADDGNIYPPQPDGQPDAKNPLLEGGQTAMGSLTVPGAGELGYFACLITDPRPAEGEQLFVRIFNAPTLNEASFYGDSQIFTVHGNDRFLADIPVLKNPLDEDDDDDDGLINAWEKSYGTYMEMLDDTDGDGMTDQEEHLAGTDSTSSSSVFEVLSVSWVSGNMMRLVWPSRQGKKYMVTHHNGEMEANSHFVNISGVITGKADTTSFDLNLNGQDLGTVRIEAVE